MEKIRSCSMMAVGFKWRPLWKDFGCIGVGKALELGTGRDGVRRPGSFM